MYAHWGTGQRSSRIALKRLISNCFIGHTARRPLLAIIIHSTQACEPQAERQSRGDLVRMETKAYKETPQE